MSETKKVQTIVEDIDALLIFIHEQIDESKLNLEDQYKQIGYTYFKMFCCHLESVLILINNNYFSSAIVLMRTMLELFVKSFYFELIEKEKGSRVEDFINGEKDFPSFFQMSKALEDYEHAEFGTFQNSFNQFTKTGLASYEKFSLFSHGRGELLDAFYKHNNISYSTEQISDVVLSAKGYLEHLSLLLFFTQGRTHAVGLLLNKIKQAKPYVRSDAAQ
jgi:Family of unknown function (DUF5677)